MQRTFAIEDVHLVWKKRVVRGRIGNQKLCQAPGTYCTQPNIEHRGVLSNTILTSIEPDLQKEVRRLELEGSPLVGTRSTSLFGGSDPVPCHRCGWVAARGFVGSMGRDLLCMRQQRQWLASYITIYKLFGARTALRRGNGSAGLHGLGGGLGRERRDAAGKMLVGRLG